VKSEKDEIQRKKEAESIEFAPSPYHIENVCLEEIKRHINNDLLQ